MRQVTTRILGTALATLVLIATAYANSVTFTPGNHPQPNEQEALFNTDVTGTTITAHTNQTHDPVDFMSSTALNGKGGQAHITAANGGDISTITITAPGHDFADYIFDAHKPTLADNIIVNVFLSNGQRFTDHFDNNNHGENFLTIVATGPALIKKIVITSSGGFQALDQNRISGLAPAVVPEPSSPLLLGIGLLGFVPALLPALRRKKLSCP